VKLPPEEAALKWDDYKRTVKRLAIHTSTLIKEKSQLSPPSLEGASGQAPKTQDGPADQTTDRELFKQRIALKRAGIDRTRGLPSHLLSSIAKDNPPTTIHSINNNNQPHHNQKDILNTFANFYEALYEHKESNPHPLLTKHIKKIPKEAQTDCAKPSTFKRLTTFLQNTDDVSAPGKDGIPYLFYKDIEPARRALLHALRAIWQTENIPQSWLESIIKPIPKERKDPTEVTNYRPIALTNTDMKSLTGIINNALQPHMQHFIPPHQTGFIKGRSTADAILRVSGILNTQRLTPLLLDFEKAYDRVSHEWLAYILYKSKLSDKVTRLILAMNKNTNAQILVNNTLSERFKIKSGVKQGDPISSLLFVICLQPLLYALEEAGIKLHAHADDTALFLKNNQQLTRATELITIYEQTTGQKLNKKKCSLLVNDKETNFNDHPYNETTEDRYLGINLTHKGRITILPGTMDTYRDLLHIWKRRRLPLKDRVTLLNSYARPKILYQLVFTDPPSTNWISNIERWFLWSEQLTFYDNTKYKTRIAKPRLTHPISLFGLVPIENNIDNRRAKLYATMRLKNPTLRYPPPDTNNTDRPSPLDLLFTATNKLINDGRLPRRITNYNPTTLAKFIKTTTANKPIPLTKRQQHWEKMHSISIKKKLQEMRKLKCRSAITSFYWKLLNGALPTGNHRSPPVPCTCGEEENTEHIFEHKCPLLQQITTQHHTLTDLLTSTNKQQTTQAIISLWTTWRTRCWLKHHPTAIQHIDINGLFQSIQEEETNRQIVAFG